MGLPEVNIRTFVRTGDTPQAERTAMTKRPPHIIVTTPESLYILLTSEGGRRMLETARTLIVDEIHAVVGDKRGSHLALSIERLEELIRQHAEGETERFASTPDSGDLPFPKTKSAIRNPQSEIPGWFDWFVRHSSVRSKRWPAFSLVMQTSIAITRPIARLSTAVTVAGLIWPSDLLDSPLQAVMSGEVWDEVYDRLAQLIRQHKTTLVFVNTRRLAERVARHLGERIGDENIAAHHGSLAREQRLAAEQRLKAGELSALVATASLELGVQIGDVNLVCQLRHHSFNRQFFATRRTFQPHRRRISKRENLSAVARRVG